MVRRSPPGTPRTRADDNAETQASPEELLALLDADYTQAILEALRAEAKSARALAASCGASRPTIYRRLNSLEDAGLVTSAVAYDPDGHHRTVFEATLEAVAVEMTDDGLSITVSTEQSDRAAAQSVRSVAAD